MSKSILIVDDKPEIAKVITIQLSRDYNVHSEGNPIEALAWMHAGNIPDLIISDVNMPEMDGRTFLKSKFHVQFYSRYYLVQLGE